MLRVQESEDHTHLTLLLMRPVVILAFEINRAGLGSYKAAVPKITGFDLPQMKRKLADCACYPSALAHLVPTGSAAPASFGPPSRLKLDIIEVSSRSESIDVEAGIIGGPVGYRDAVRERPAAQPCERHVAGAAISTPRGARYLP